MRKCVCLYSGGLDSRLVIALMSSLPGIEVVAYHGLHCFEGKDDFTAIRERVGRDCRKLGAKDVVFRDMTPQIAGLLRENRYGFGKNLNPCLDCRINTVSNGFSVMREIGADFICTGEVLGQRPKSQQRDGMNAVQKAAERLGCAGLLLRPLCAKLMEPTIPETEGWVSRESLYSFSGRSRQQQFQLADKLGVDEFPAPAGGCLLTDVGYCRRLQDLREIKKDLKNNDFDLLKFGRHYRLPDGAKIVVARDAQEGDKLDELAQEGDVLYITAGQPGALVLLRGQPSAEAENAACALAKHYSKFRAEPAVDIEKSYPQGSAGTAQVLPNFSGATPEEILEKGVITAL